MAACRVRMSKRPRKSLRWMMKSTAVADAASAYHDTMSSMTGCSSSCCMRALSREMYDVGSIGSGGSRALTGDGCSDADSGSGAPPGD